MRGMHIDKRTLLVAEHIDKRFGITHAVADVSLTIAAGEIRESDSDVEEIEAGWYTRQEIRELLKTSRFAARTQAYCYLWSKE